MAGGPEGELGHEGGEGQADQGGPDEELANGQHVIILRVKRPGPRVRPRAGARVNQPLILTKFAVWSRAVMLPLLVALRSVS